MTDAAPLDAELLVHCDDADLAVECARLGHLLGRPVAPSASPSALDDALRSLGARRCCGLALSRGPTVPEVTSLARASFATRTICVLACLVDPEEFGDVLDLATELGIVVVHELRPLLAALCLLQPPTASAWSASTRGMSTFDRARLRLRGGGSTHGRFVRLDEGMVGFAAGAGVPGTLGEPRDVGEAVRALRESHGATPPGRAVMDGVDNEAVTAVLFGPPRALSDPATKAALAPYGLPLPLEELCASPSRAAAEAARIGFPVRIALASPDLRVWDHPDLAVDGIDNSARVRDVFRQIMAMASERRPEARLLGVTVTATTTATALLGVRASPLDAGWVLLDLGFSDAHGLAAKDRTLTVLPASSERVERTLSRLRGSPLLLSGSAARRKATVEAISDALLRLAAFVDRHRDAVVSVEIRPLAVVVGGGVEVREACVTVGDAYLRTLG